jgi:hypothetical protein
MRCGTADGAASPAATARCFGAPSITKRTSYGATINTGVKSDLADAVQA